MWQILESSPLNPCLPFPSLSLPLLSSELYDKKKLLFRRVDFLSTRLMASEKRELPLSLSVRYLRSLLLPFFPHHCSLTRHLQLLSLIIDCYSSFIFSEFRSRVHALIYPSSAPFFTASLPAIFCYFLFIDYVLLVRSSVHPSLHFFFL